MPQSSSVGAGHVLSRHQNMQQFFALDMGERVREHQIPRLCEFVYLSLSMSRSMYICKVGHYAKHEG